MRRITYRFWKHRAGMGLIGLVLLVAHPALAADPCVRQPIEACLQETFSGAVVVVRQGQVLLRGAYGRADATTNNTVEHRFRIGSLSKTFTGSLVHQLAADGRIDLEVPIGRYLAGFEGDGTTARQLLDHTSGRGDFTQKQWRQLWLGSPTKAEVQAWARNVKRGQAGRQRYSNAGYVILAELVEAVAGEPFEDLVPRKVLQPLRLVNTGLAATDAEVSGMSSGHDAKGRADPADYRYSAVAPIGGFYSTVDDLVTWARALTDTNSIGVDFVNEPAGWQRGERFGRKAMWHSGLTNTHSAFVLRFRDEDSMIVLLGNRGGSRAAPGPLVRSIAAHYFGEAQQ